MQPSPVPAVCARRFWPYEGGGAGAEDGDEAPWRQALSGRGPLAVHKLLLCPGCGQPDGHGLQRAHGDLLLIVFLTRAGRLRVGRTPTRGRRCVALASQIPCLCSPACGLACHKQKESTFGIAYDVI